MSKTRQRFASIFFLLSLVIVGWWLFNRIYWNFNLPSLAGINQLIEQVKLEYDPLVNNPVFFERESSESLKHLDVNKVFTLTNQERSEEGLASLSRNNFLDQAAEIKAEDMFTRQYFAHDSPDGEGISSLAFQVGYRFILIGENLAMGNFKNEEELVQGWMDSPGHRQNILHNRYREIGLAAKKGFFGDRESWMIVQVFGLSLSLCPEPSQELKLLIDSGTKLLSEKHAELQKVKDDIGDIWPHRGEEYRRLSEEYNLLIQEYNDLVSQQKANIKEYNNQIEEFNYCIQFL